MYKKYPAGNWQVCDAILKPGIPIRFAGTYYNSLLLQIGNCRIPVDPMLAEKDTMDMVNHCLVKRTHLEKFLQEKQLSSQIQIRILADGETIEI